MKLPRLLPKIWTDPVWSKVIASAIVAIGGLLFVLILNPRGCVKPPPPRISLRIISPEPGAAVERGTVVSFTSPFVDRDHYVTVIPLQSPDRYVVDGPLRISADQMTSGRARFGNEAAGIGEQFSIQIVATKEVLAEAETLDQLPKDAELSPQVVVYRAR